MNEPVLTAQALSLGYPQADGVLRTVLQRFDLDLAAGEVVSILGPSGVGKSSLLRVLAGLQKPLQGQVRVQGQPLHAPHPQVAVAFQDPSLLPWLSLEKNVAFGLDFKSQGGVAPELRRQRVDAAIAAVGLSHARDLHPAQLSGGMAQRTALARCLAREPAVLLLDEPFGALDEVTRADMQALLLQLMSQRRTAALLITHDIDEALLLSDRILLLGGTPAQVVGQWQIELPHPRSELLDELGALRVDILKTLRRASRNPATSTEPLEIEHVLGRPHSLAS